MVTAGRPLCVLAEGAGEGAGERAGERAGGEESGEGEGEEAACIDAQDEAQLQTERSSKLSSNRRMWPSCGTSIHRLHSSSCSSSNCRMSSYATWSCSHSCSSRLSRWLSSSHISGPSDSQSEVGSTWSSELRPTHALASRLSRTRRSHRA